MKTSYENCRKDTSAFLTFLRCLQKPPCFLQILQFWIAINLFIIFSQNTSRQHPKELRQFWITLYNNLIHVVESHKYPGIMTLDKHINYMVSKNRQIIFAFTKIKISMNCKSFISIFYAFFQIIVNYGMKRSVQKLSKINFKNINENTVKRECFLNTFHSLVCKFIFVGV